MSTIRVKITDPNMPEHLRVWYASAWDDGRGPEATIRKLNRAARSMAARRPNHWLAPAYELATEEAYWEYRRSINHDHTTPS